MRSIVPLLPSRADDLGVSVATAGLVATAYMLPYGAFHTTLLAMAVAMLGFTVLGWFGLRRSAS